jgi:hypothetical protein
MLDAESTSIMYRDVTWISQVAQPELIQIELLHR